ncbi:MAG: hypothetical protein ACKOX6_11765 [Bdellovibrio sp.]
MKISKLYKPLMSGLLCTLLLSGFTGKEKYIELEGLANGRSSANFKRSGNVLTTLPRGTHGEIMKATKLRSGNYGIKIKILNGPNAGRTMWVYHRMNGNSTLALYKKIPSNWDSSSQTEAKSETRPEPRSEEKQNRTNDPTRAVATLTIRETRTAIDNQDTTATETPAARESSTQNEEISELSALSAIDDTNKRLRNEKADNEECADCAITASGRRSLLRPGHRAMAPACNALMNSQGQIGPSGQIVYDVLNSPNNRSAYTKRNALGSFCPNFNQLSDSDKLIAWTWFWTALAREESACDPYIVHATRSGGRIINPRVGYGLWAMEQSSNIRRGRGPECSDISTIKGQARCAIEIMKDTQLDNGETAHDGGSYWGPIRRAHRQIIPHMKRLTLCF